MKTSSETFNTRARILLWFFALIFGILIFKLYSVQIVNTGYFSDLGDRQYLRPSTDIFDRGQIYFETKEGSRIAAATLKTGYILAINPLLVEDAEATWSEVEEFIDYEKDEFIRRANLDDPYEEIAKRLDKETADTIEKKDLPGVYLYKEKWRYYPGESLAAQVVGFMSFIQDDLKGRYGLESYYEDLLSRDGENLYVNVFVELFSSIKQTFTRKKKSGSLVTTIEPSVQAHLEEILKDINDKWYSDLTGGIIMNPQDGEIYGMSSYPSFDLNNFSEVSDIAVYKNPNVESVFEMGSVVKPLTMAIGLDTESVTPNTTYYDAGFKTLDGRTFYNYDKKGRGTVPMQEVLNQSLNTGVAFVVEQVGKEDFRKYMLKLIGEETGIDLPNERQPLVSNLESNRAIEYATASFGQGIAMTPIALTRALAALGNGGKLVDPHVVREIDYIGATSKKIVLPDPEPIFSEKTSEDISRMLVKVVDDALGGGTVALENYTIAAKTGTAQLVKPDSSAGYYDDKFLHSFFGYFPAYNPQFIVFLYTVDPKGVQYASETLTDPFMDTATFLLQYYDAPPDR